MSGRSGSTTLVLADAVPQPESRWTTPTTRSSPAWCARRNADADAVGDRARRDRPIDIAGSFLNRVLVTASLPITFFESGQTSTLTSTRGDQRSSVGPAPGCLGSALRPASWQRVFAPAPAVSCGFAARLHRLRSPSRPSDQQVRSLLRVAMGGLKYSIMWSATFGRCVRPEARLLVTSWIRRAARRAPSCRRRRHRLRQPGARRSPSDSKRCCPAAPATCSQQLCDELGPAVGAHTASPHVQHRSGWRRRPTAVRSGTPMPRQCCLAYAPMPKPEPRIATRDGVPDVQTAAPTNAGETAPIPRWLWLPRARHPR